MRLAWVKMYHQTKNAGVVCRRCGISRPTLRKWVRRYQEAGIEGLEDQSRRPKTCTPKKVFAQQKQWILKLRRTRKLGARRLLLGTPATTRFVTIHSNDSQSVKGSSS